MEVNIDKTIPDKSEIKVNRKIKALSRKELEKLSKEVCKC